ncbi:MAG: hypothetical protein HC913_20010 [Microscillaceae bacterium]|nr:hypothetical protein [Microscillaceae bacterium]
MPSELGVKAGLFFFLFAPNVPVFFGLDFGYMVYGSNTQRINENLLIQASNGLILGNIPINLRVRTNNNLFNGHAVLRIKAPLATVQPYVDGLVGFNYLSTRTKVFDETQPCLFCDNPDGSNVINASTQEQSFVLSYGGALGMQIRLGETVSLDVRGIYLLGGEAEYFDRSQTQDWTISFTGSGAFNPNNPNPEDLDLNAPDAAPKRSKTDMFLATVGLTFNF